MPSSSSSSISKDFRFDGFPRTTNLDGGSTEAPTTAQSLPRQRKETEDLLKRLSDREREIQGLKTELAQTKTDLDRCRVGMGRLQDEHQDAREYLAQASTQMQQLRVQMQDILSAESDQDTTLSAVRQALEGRWLPHLMTVAQEIEEFLNEDPSSLPALAPHKEAEAESPLTD